MNTKQITALLMAAEQALNELVIDAQDECEDAGEFTPGMFTGENDDVPICVPEEAAPEIDAARSSVLEALEALSMIPAPDRGSIGEPS